MGGGSLPSETIGDGKESLAEKDFSNRQGTPAVSPYRWVIVTLYTLVYFGHCSSGVVYAVADLMCKYYGITDYQITWSGNASYFTQLFGYLIGTTIASKLGLRTTVVLSSGLNAISACIMFAGAQPQGFPFFVSGYVIQTMSNCLIASLAPEISATWFEKDFQVQATNFGLNVGYCVGYSIGFLIPAIAFKSSERNKSMQYVGDALFWIIGSQVIFALILFLMVLMFFRECPKVPPTLAEAKRSDIASKGKAFCVRSMLSDISHIARNGNFQLVAISLAMIEYTNLAIVSQLNQLLTWKYKGSEAIVGWVGFAAYWLALAGAALLGKVVDRTKRWKLCAVVFSIISALCWIGFSECLRQLAHLPATFSMFFLHAFFSAPLVPVLTDAVVEMTYPIAPSHSYVYVLTIEQVYGITIVFLSGWLFHVRLFDVYLWVLSGAFILATVLLSISKVETQRSFSELAEDEKTGRDSVNSR